MTHRILVQERLESLRLLLSQVNDGEYAGDAGFGPFRTNKVEALLGRREFFGNLYDKSNLTPPWMKNEKHKAAWIETRMASMGFSDEVTAILAEYTLTETLTDEELEKRSETDIDRGINLTQGEIDTAVLGQLLSIQDLQGVVELYNEVGIAEDELPAFLTERSEFANDLQRKMFEVRGEAFGDDRIAMIESAEFQDVLRASIQSIVLYEVENNEEYPLRIREYATTNRKQLAEDVRVLPTGPVFKEVVGAATDVNWLAGVEPNAPTYEMAGSEWFAIEYRIVELTGRLPDERLEMRLAQEIRDAESTDPVKYFTENWEPTIGEFVSAYDRIDVEGYDGTLTPLVEQWLDPNIKGQLRVDLRNALKQKLLEHYNNTGIQNKHDLVRDYLGVTDESPAPNYSGYEAAINDYMAIMVGDDGIAAGLTAAGLTYARLLGVAPEGTALNNAEEIIDYVYSWVEDWNVGDYDDDAGQAAPISPTSTRLESNVLIRRELIKELGSNTFANIPNSMYGALFERIESELQDASRAGNVVQDAAGVTGFINKHASRLVSHSIRQQILSVAGGEDLLNSWESMGVQTMDGLMNMVENGTLDGGTYDFTTVSEQIANAAPVSQRQSQVQGRLTNAGLGLLPVIERGSATQAAVNHFNNLFNRDEYRIAYPSVFDREQAVMDSDEFKEMLTVFVDQSLEQVMSQSALTQAMIELYGSSRNVVEAANIDPTNMTSGEYIDALEEFGLALSTTILDGTHTPESVDKFSTLRDSFKNSQGDVTEVQKFMREAVLSYAEKEGITDVEDISSLLDAALSFADSNIGPLRVYQSPEDFMESDIQGEISRIATEQGEADIKKAEAEAEADAEEALSKLRTSSLRTFIEDQGLNPADVATFGNFAQSLFNQLESSAEEDTTPEEIIASAEFTEAFAKERKVFDEREADYAERRAEKELEEETPLQKAMKERQVADTAHSLLAPQLQEHIRKFLGSSVNYNDLANPADTQRDFEKYVQDQQAMTAERAQDQSGTGYLATQTTGEVLSFGDFINKLDSDESPTSSADFYQSFLTTQLGNEVLVGKQRQGRVNRIRTATPTGGRQIQNPSLGVGL